MPPIPIRSGSSRAPIRCGWLATRRSRTVLLSGDVHYAFAARLAYWATHPYLQSPRSTTVTAVIAQLTSSALHNEDYGSAKELLWLKSTNQMHRGGYVRQATFDMAAPDDVKGWNVTPSARMRRRSARASTAGAGPGRRQAWGAA